MRNKLRLLITEKCNRNCEGCCNQYWDFESLPTFNYLKELTEYNELIITGGEPMLIREVCSSLAYLAHYINPDILVYLYTAKTTPLKHLTYMLPLLDGICITIHEQSDVEPFLMFHDWIMMYDVYVGKSLRLNIFDQTIKIKTENLKKIWKVKDKKWISHKHLNKNEIFKKLK
jgi:organic radical activating enzyme